MAQIIPGQFRAYNVWMALAYALVALVFTTNGWVILGAVFVACFPFFSEQATHLGQMEHKGKTPTWIERMQEKYRWFFFGLGIVLSSGGLALVIWQATQRAVPVWQMLSP